MSLGIAFKGPEGIVLAADSRVTLTAETQNGKEKIRVPSTFDNATKLLHINGHEFVGVVTYGVGAIGLQEPRTANSFLPEFEDTLSKDENKCLPIEEFAKRLSGFFQDQWNKQMPKHYAGPDIVFLVGGFNAGAPYGKVYRVVIPSSPEPLEQHKNQFGITWGGQLEYTTRLIKGFDPQLPSIAQKFLGLTDEQRDNLQKHLEGELCSQIPYAFLPLQDCVNLSIFLIQTTIGLQNWTVGVRGVGGAIDVATITRTHGFKPVQQKTIVGQRTLL